MKKVLVISHERSGTHFLMNSLAINFRLNPRWIDVYCKDYIDPEDNYKKNYKNQIKKFFEEQYPIVTDRIYKSHHQFGYYEDIMDDVMKNFEVFYIHRDVRDTLSSCYRYFKSAQVTAFPNCDTMEEFLFQTPPYLYPFDGAYSYIKSENMVERWNMHIKSWKPVFDKINVISYTDLKSDFNNTIQKISSMLNTPIISEIRVPPIGQNTINPGSGINGGWKKTMSEETANKIMEMIK